VIFIFPLPPCLLLLLLLFLSETADKYRKLLEHADSGKDLGKADERLLLEEASSSSVSDVGRDAVAASTADEFDLSSVSVGMDADDSDDSDLSDSDDDSDSDDEDAELLRELERLKAQRAEEKKRQVVCVCVCVCVYSCVFVSLYVCLFFSLSLSLSLSFFFFSRTCMPACILC
jgi:Cwf15/Cwc15 cell cycle control protein